MDRNEMMMSLGIAPAQERSAAADDLLDALYDEHARALYCYALALTSSPEDAEDAVQEVFIGLARQQKRLQRINNMRAYLLKATRNAAYTLLRGRQRRGAVERALVDHVQGQHQKERVGSDAGILRECFARLPVEQREVLVLKIFQGMTFRESAQVLGISINTAASRYRYGIEKLREALEDTKE